MNNEELLAQMQKSKIEMIEVDKLVPYALNAKLHTDDQVDELVALMREVGYTQPILLDGGFEIIAGHGRLLALKKLGMKQGPCIRLPHLTEAQKRAYRLADNQQTMKTGWDRDILKIELSELNDLGGLNFDIGLIGFDQSFLNDLLIEKNFDPGSEDDQGKLDRKKPVQCPGCGHEFVP